MRPEVKLTLQARYVYHLGLNRNELSGDCNWGVRALVNVLKLGKFCKSVVCFMSGKAVRIKTLSGYNKSEYSILILLFLCNRPTWLTVETLYRRISKPRSSKGTGT